MVAALRLRGLGITALALAASSGCTQSDPERPTLAVEEVRDGKVVLGSPRLVAGIPGEGPLRLSEIKAWLADARNHESLEFVLPLGLVDAADQVSLPDDNLLTRAADVHLKERRRLVLIVRESPLHLGHLRAMAAVTEYGAIIAPAVPAFYLRPNSVGDIVDQIARRAIDLLALSDAALSRSWTGFDGASDWRGA